MIQAVIFDIGGVIIRTVDHSQRRAWEKKLKLAERESEEIVFGGEMGTRAQQGAVSESELWQWIGQRLALDDDQLDAFRHGFWSGDVVDIKLVDYIRRLRPHYQTAVISNATDGLRRSLSEQHLIADAFDLIVCSAEEKVMKPDPGIYRLTLQRLGRQPEESVFIDDALPNIKAARSLGMHAVHFTPGIDLPAELAKLGVEPALEADTGLHG